MQNITKENMELNRIMANEKCMYIIHRVNSIEKLQTIPHEFGVEIDIRGYGDKLLLNHDPIKKNGKYDVLDDYLSNYHHSFIVFNVKEAGYEELIIESARKHRVQDYFFLDVEFPFFYRYTRTKGFRKIAVRFSEAEPIEFTLAQKNEEGFLIDWVWIDTNTQLPLNKDNYLQMQGLKMCLVSPDRWGRPEDILQYAKDMKDNNLNIQAIMTELQYVPLWKQQYG